jgi:hypothetical protein
MDLHVVRYEDLRRDTVGSLGEILAFLGLDAPEEGVRAAVAGNTIEAMREKERRARSGPFERRDGSGGFVRRGATGEARAWLDAEDIRLIERTAGEALRRLGYPAVPEVGGPARGAVTPPDREP